MRIVPQMSSVEGWLGDRGTAYSTGRQSNEDISVYVRKDGNQTLHKRGTYSDIKDELKDEGNNIVKIFMQCYVKI